MKVLRVSATLLEPLLGTTPGDKDLVQRFIQDQCPVENLDEEQAAVRDACEEVILATNFLPKDEDGYFIWDYQIRGFLKSATLASILSGAYTKEQLKKLGIFQTRYKRFIDLLVFVSPRRIRLGLSGEVTFNERPLRGETLRGERVCLARSEQAPAGSTFEFKVHLKNPAHEPFIRECLEYGQFNGLLGWRNGSYGRFECEIEDGGDDGM